ncbi:SoxR reducing system RseC family protein [Anaeroselena agilis]|uniref:SoxR reducing system RseC family protein n=1 Tax=Anaeroselena agilis TaxID=3063788 RepID=A0ABU3NZS4_9FIRM|nr:SoxR reducing system RseC family protein [Selenomonadales bacterium 4137-cl]
MSMKQEGIVISSDGEMARVRTSRHNDCENCGACPGNDALVLDVRNPLGAKPGQLVMIEVQEVGFLKSAFIVYILPLIAMALGAMAGGYAADRLAQEPLWFQIGGAAAAFVASVGYIRFFDKSASANKNMQPVIIQILS